MNSTKKKSRHGTSYLRRDFSSGELCKIIETCSQSGVSTLSIGEIRLEFKSASTGQGVVEALSVQAQKDPEKEQMQAIIEAQARRLDNLQQKEEEYMNLPLIDPVAWEELESNRDWEADINAENS